MPARTLKLAQVVTTVDVESALRDVESACGCETSNLLRAVFAGFQLIANGARLVTDIVYGIDEDGKPRLFLVMRFPDEPGTARV